jgi:glucose/arabinose dehydrogenase
MEQIHKVWAISRVVWILGLSLVIIEWLSLSARAQPEQLKTLTSADQAVVVERLVKGLGIPWGFDFLPGGRYMIITERQGQMKLLDLKTLKTASVTGVPAVYAQGQGGLLDVLLHPNFRQNRLLYLTYAVKVKNGNSTRLARARLIGTKLKKFEVLFTAQPPGQRNIHFGSRLSISTDGHLFMTVGDRGKRQRAQNLATHSGKVLRFRLDGSVPADNPFVGRKGARPEIWTLGHRNPQGLTIHPTTGDIWEQEHGPKGGDEINILVKGENYGWPVVTYGREYSGPKIGEGTHKQGMRQPVKYWVPSIAPSGMDFYQGKAFPQWQGSLFSGSMVLTHLNRLTMKGQKVKSEERLLDSWGARVRNVKIGPDGLVYFAVDRGMILRLKPSPKTTDGDKKSAG